MPSIERRSSLTTTHSECSPVFRLPGDGTPLWLGNIEVGTSMFPSHSGVPSPGSLNTGEHSECVVVSELRRSIDGISQRMLTLTLRQLERDGLVSRTVHATVPPRVDYALTPLGR